MTQLTRRVSEESSSANVQLTIVSDVNWKFTPLYHGPYPLCIFPIASVPIATAVQEISLWFDVRKLSFFTDAIVTVEWYGAGLIPADEIFQNKWSLHADVSVKILL